MGIQHHSNQVKYFSENMLSKTLSVVISIEQSVVLPLTQMLLPMSRMIVSSVLRCFAQLLLGVARLLDNAREDLVAPETPITSHTTKVVEVPKDVQTIYTATNSSCVHAATVWTVALAKICVTACYNCKLRWTMWMLQVMWTRTLVCLW